ncbi:ABC transporter substrate-binding protein [Mesorhizobium opportunistum]|uniref:ABC transporter substrate-binding protein n=1 Tax=Mesorhizobium opportunistum TaxID=593909 RepID=A0ABV1YEE9_9HYPH
MWKNLPLAAVVVAGTFGCAMHAALADGLDELPPDIQKAYQGLDQNQPVGPSPLKDFKPKKGPPWTIGFASSYAGNTWRAASMDKLMNDLLPAAQKAGLVKDVIVTQSDLKDSVQIQQMRQLVDQGADAIFICCSNVTALNQTIKYAYDKGVPVFSYSGYVTAPEAISASANYVDGGYQIAKGIFETIKGKGNVLLVSGIAGLASSDSFDKGVMRALAESPDIKLVGTVQGQWTDQVAQVEVQKFLATHPGQLDAIVVQSPAENGVLQAMLQSGRPMVPISISGEAGAVCYWRKNPNWVDAGNYVWPPAAEVYIVWNMMLRTLEGQGPKIQSVIRPVLKFTYDDVKASMPEDCSIDDPKWFEPKAEAWFPKSMADAMVTRPADPFTWKPAN